MLTVWNLTDNKGQFSDRSHDGIQGQLLVARLQRMKRVAWWIRPELGELGLSGTLALTSGKLSKQLNWYLACHTRRGEWPTLGAKDTLWRRIQIGVERHCGATRICREICLSTPLTTWIPWIEPIWYNVALTPLANTSIDPGTTWTLPQTTLVSLSGMEDL